MVFEKGHKPFNKKKGAEAQHEFGNFFVKFGVKNNVKGNLSSLSYLISELKKDLSIINNFRQKKAVLRKEFYEVLVSLRMNMDSMEKYMPSKEFEALKRTVEEISKFAIKQEKERAVYEAPKRMERIRADRIIPREKPREVVDIKKEFTRKPEPVVKKKDDFYESASDAEKRELELLKKDLEEISRQLGNVEE